MISYGGVEHRILHRCPTSGLALVECFPEGKELFCTPPGEECGAPIIPDQLPRSGHAWVFCPHCQASIGICGAGALEELAAEAARAVD